MERKFPDMVGQKSDYEQRHSHSSIVSRLCSDPLRAKTYRLIEFINPHDNVRSGETIEITCVYNVNDMIPTEQRTL